MTEPKTERVNLRVVSRDDELFRQEGACERAARVLAGRTRFVLSEEDWAAFSEALDRPAQADPALAELFRRPRPA